MPRSCLILFLVAIVTSTAISFGQSNGVPAGIITRVVYLKNGTLTGTGFLIDYKGKEYLVTARHVVEGLSAHNPKLQFYRSADWHDLASDIVLPKNEKVDIAVLDIHSKPSLPLDLKVELTGESPTLGGQVYFLGYPFGLHSLQNSGEYLPLVKAGVFSGLDNSDSTELLYYIDGFNNPGFSGGPCVYIDNSTHVWRIFGVIQGYKPDSIKTKIRGKDVDTGLLSNSGILLAYPIDEALKAIDLTLAK